MKPTWHLSDLAIHIHATFNDTLDGMWKFAEHTDDLRKLELQKLDDYFPKRPEIRSMRWHVERLKLDDAFPRLLNYSFLVHGWILLETSCLSLCQALQKKKGNRFKIRDISGAGLERYLLYFDRLGICTKSALKNYPAVVLIGRLRNCIVHANGLITDSKDQDEIKHGLSQRLTFYAPTSDDARKMSWSREVSVEPSSLGERLRFKQHASFYLTACLRNFLLEILIHAGEIERKETA